MWFPFHINGNTRSFLPENKGLQVTSSVMDYRGFGSRLFGKLLGPKESCLTKDHVSWNQRKTAEKCPWLPQVRGRWGTGNKKRKNWSLFSLMSTLGYWKTFESSPRRSQPFWILGFVDFFKIPFFLSVLVTCLPLRVFFPPRFLSFSTY